MSLQAVELPLSVLSELYKNSLISIDEKPDTSAIQPISTLGNNAQKITIIVKNSDNLYLPDNELNFLTDILSACKLSMNDVAIVNIQNNSSVNFKSIVSTLNSSKVLLFGVLPKEISLIIDDEFYQITPINKVVCLVAPSLTELQSNKAEKIKLWNCLKQIFSI